MRTMAASKVLCALIVLFAVSGSMAQTQAQTSAIVAACGMATALQLQPLGTACSQSMKNAKTCPSACLQVASILKGKAACEKAFNAVVTSAQKKLVSKVCATKPAKTKPSKKPAKTKPPKKSAKTKSPKKSKKGRKFV